MSRAMARVRRQQTGQGSQPRGWKIWHRQAATALSWVAIALASGGVSPVQAQPVVQPLPAVSASQALNLALGRLGRDPRDLDALIDAGKAAVAMGDIDAALGFFGRADQLSPENMRVKAGLAAALVRSENPYDAIPLFAEADKAGALDPALIADRGLAYDLVGDNATAQRYYRESLAARPSPETVRRLALSQALAGDRSAMERTLAPQLQQQDKAGWRTRAFALAILQKPEEAIAIADMAMPGDMAQGIAPYLRYMPRLTPAQQAAAANFGRFPRAAEIGRDDPRVALYAPPKPVALADAALVPSGKPLGKGKRNSRDDRRALADARSAAAPASPVAASLRSAPPDPMPTRQVSAAPIALGTIPPPAAVAAPAATAMLPQPRPVSTAIPAPVVAAPLPARPSASPPVAPVVTLAVAAPAAPAVSPAAAPVRPALPAASPPAAAPVALVPSGGFDLSRIDAARTPAATPPAPAPVQAPAATPAAVTPLETPPAVVAVPAPVAATVAAPVAAPAPAPAAPRRALAEAFAEFTVPTGSATPAPGAVDVRKIAAAKPKPAEPPKPVHPSRIWVQVGTGRDPKALGFTWKALVRENAALFRGREPAIADWGRTNRLLTGPFASEAQADAFLAKAKKADLDAFVWTSPAGQVVDDLAVR